MRSGDEILIERQTGSAVRSPKTIVRRKVDRIIGQYLEVRRVRFRRDTGAGVGPGSGRLVKPTPANMRTLEKEEAEEEERKRATDTAATVEKARQRSGTFAAAEWLRSQAPETIVDSLGVAVLFELGERLSIPPAPERTT